MNFNNLYNNLDNFYYNFDEDYSYFELFNSIDNLIYNDFFIDLFKEDKIYNLNFKKKGKYIKTIVI